MHVELFSITCPTCKARLKVRDAAAVGQILACPKCHSMVEIAAPADWEPPSLPTTKFDPLSLSGSDVVSKTPAGPWRTDSGVHDAGPQPQAAPPTAGPLPSFPVPPGSAAGRWLPWACVPLAAVASALAVWLFLGPRQADTVQPQPQPVAMQPVEPIAVKPLPKPLPILVEAPDARWLPTEARAVLTVRLVDLLSNRALRPAVFRTKPLWENAIGQVLEAFKLAPEQIQRVTWAVLDAERIDPASVALVVELSSPIEKLDPWLKHHDRAARKAGPIETYRSKHWPQPFLIADKRTIVAAPAETLERLAVRSALPATPIHRAWQALSTQSQIAAVVEMPAWRRALLQAASWLERWGAPHTDAQSSVELAQAAAIELSLEGELRGALTLVCETDSIAQRAAASLERAADGIEARLAADAGALAKTMLALPLSTATAEQVHLVLDHGWRWLRDRDVAVRDTSARLSSEVVAELPEVILAALVSVPELEMTRLAGARVRDEQNHAGLLRALSGVVSKESKWPAAADGAPLLPAESRLSWIAALLPYYGSQYFEWRRNLHPGQPWNAADNAPVAKRPLDAVTNPALGMSMTGAGYPVTHYVGLAGVGSGAAELDTTDPRAGVFSYRRRTAAADIVDGSSNTIAIMGVTGKLGAWAAGGQPTVRALTARPYINGPDGFGSGQPGGMFVGMADGSVRFLSQDTDPAVLERLATIAGGDEREPARVTKAAPPPAPMQAIPEAAPAEDAALAASRAEALARLEARLPAIELPSATLAQFCAFLTQVSTLPITLDPDALAARGLRLEDTISIPPKRDVRLADLLGDVLAERELEYVLIGGQVLVTWPEAERLRLFERRYDVADLAGRDATRVVQLVRRLVAPHAWKEAGGAGSLDVAGNVLVVRQTGPVQYQIGALLEKLRRARRLPEREKIDPDSRDLASRWSKARPRLDRRVTANFGEPAALGQVCKVLESATGTHLLVNGVELAAAGRSQATIARVVADNQPLGETLDALLKPLGLGYRPIQREMIEITSLAALARLGTLELYPVGDLLGADSPEVLRERLKTQVPGADWEGASALEYDAESRHLLVLATPAMQRDVERLLERWRNENVTPQK